MVVVRLWTVYNMLYDTFMLQFHVSIRANKVLISIDFRTSEKWRMVRLTGLKIDMCKHKINAAKNSTSFEDDGNRN